MRVIAGSHRGRALQAPRGLAVRPTSDALRETLFNILSGRVADSVWVDCCAGSGAVGIEALSRGAAWCDFIECAPPALAALRENLRRLDLAGRAGVIVRPAPAGLRPCAADRGRAPRAADFLYLDPPYAEEELYAAVLESLASPDSAALAPGAWVIVEHARRTRAPESHGWRSFRRLDQGDSALTFYWRD